MAVLPAVVGIHPQVKESPGCCDRVQKALGRLWEWIVDTWHWLTQGIFRVVDGVAFGFFRVVDCVFPSLAKGMETGYLYITKWYERHAAAVQEQIREKQIGDLENVNKDLNKRVQETATRAVQLESENAQITAQRNRLQSERDADIRARVEAVEKGNSAETNAELTIQRNQFLEQEVIRLREAQSTIIRSQAPLLKTQEELKDENLELTRNCRQLEIRERNAKIMAGFAFDAAVLRQNALRLLSAEECKR